MLCFGRGCCAKSYFLINLMIDIETYRVRIGTNSSRMGGHIKRNPKMFGQVMYQGGDNLFFVLFYSIFMLYIIFFSLSLTLQTSFSPRLFEDIYYNISLYVHPSIDFAFNFHSTLSHIKLGFAELVVYLIKYILRKSSDGKIFRHLKLVSNSCLTYFMNKQRPTKSSRFMTYVLVWVFAANLALITIGTLVLI